MGARRRTAEEGKEMTIKQYSDLQRCIGKLEGIGVFMDGIVYAYYHDTIETIKMIVEEVKSEGEK